MNEWPTRARTGTPPCSRMTSGTAFEQMRLCTTVSPGCRSRIPAATIAVVVEPLTGWPGVVDEEHAVGVAVEREADVGAEVEHRALEVLQVLGLDRVGGMVRERAVELAVQHRERERQPLEDLRDDEPAHAVGGVGDDGERPQHRGVDERPHVVAERLEQVERARPCPRTSPRDVTPAATISLIWVRPVCSPTGAAPARHSLMPLYCAGLWLAVNIAPGASSLPAAK